VRGVADERQSRGGQPRDRLPNHRKHAAAVGVKLLVIEIDVDRFAEEEADAAAVTPELTSHPIALWAMAWRARSAAWMIRHRRTLETALSRGAP